MKNHRAETRREIRGFPCNSSKILGERLGPFLLTLGKVGTSASTRNSPMETAVTGWVPGFETGNGKMKSDLVAERYAGMDQATGLKRQRRSAKASDTI